MVFSNLPSNEKDAFFSLLDELSVVVSSDFTHLRTQMSFAPLDVQILLCASRAPTTSISRPDFSKLNSRLSESTSKFVSPGLTRSSPHNASPAVSPPPLSSPMPDHHTIAPQSSISAVGGRVAAASRAFSAAASRDSDSSPAAHSPPPAMPPRYTSSYGASSPSTDSAPPSALAQHTRAPSDSTSKLLPTRKFGSDVDTSSAKSMLLSIRHGTANKSREIPSVVPPLPPALPHQKNAFAPPPRRTLAPEPEPEPEPEPAQEGEWAETLYDYSSEESGDLQLQANQRVLVTDKTSADWCVPLLFPFLFHPHPDMLCSLMCVPFRVTQVDR
ncbi:hypothetical protein EW146_g9316 [Bondarzewia mesenterica]|uniref:SH3 domain-containing protein n=1 Tax=Bondarzewia mesenterica TaxID=1095465 RepID=A0A4S4L7W3_9AGAM|nr:hypothetical protein EW146_g9316 [Bondarzewia mesenterica]